MGRGLESKSNRMRSLVNGVIGRGMYKEASLAGHFKDTGNKGIVISIIRLVKM